MSKRHKKGGKRDQLTQALITLTALANLIRSITDLVKKLIE